MNKKGKTQRGITLIALVITIIVMLILVAVTISMAVNGGLFDYAGKAVSETNNTLKAEGQLADGGIEVGDKWYNSIDEYLNKDNVETISKTESYVGYYADVDADGTVDGVIYADLAFSKEGYYQAETGLKDYYVSKTNYQGNFGTKDVLTATGEGKDRFYVMALTDIGGFYTWYESKTSDGVTVSTSMDFGTGKANTEAMIAFWNADTDEAKSSSDIWGHIQLKASDGWFVPSRGEWEVIVNNLNIYEDYVYPEDDPDSPYLEVPFGMDGERWSSSLVDIGTASFCSTTIGGSYPHGDMQLDFAFTVRLCVKF